MLERFCLKYFEKSIVRFLACFGDMSHIAEYLIAGGGRVADPYMCLADFDAYRMRYEAALADYADGEVWTKRSLANIALSGRFSSDRSVSEYAERIWHLGRIPT